ncbi:hypothetical protein GCM10027340_16010 [Marinomonas epiphytica]
MTVQFVQNRNQVSSSVLGDVGVQLVSGYEKHGLEHLRAEANKAEKKLFGRIYLYKENGTTLLKPLPRDIRQGAAENGRAALAADVLNSQFIQVVGSENVQYLMIFKPNPKIDALAPEFFIAFLLLGLLVSSGILAYWLLGPLLKLQRVARSFGKGDMSVRVEGGLARRNDAIGKLAHEFNEMAERIEDLLSSKERLMRDVSHELRTPLARIEVALTIAEDKHGEKQQEKYLDRIRTELHELDELIGQVLNLSRLEESSLKKEKMQLQEWLDEIVADVNFESQLKGISVSKVGDKPESMVGDPLQLRHAIENILRNACCYASDGGLVEVVTEQVQQEVLIYVRDNGPGVEEEKLDKIFHAFYRTDESRGSSKGGFGVGMTIAQRIVRAHKGEISAKNRPQGGLEVCFRLPVT